MLELFENDYFGDAYYDLKYRRNRTLRKPMNLPKDKDVTLLLDECKTVIESIDEYDYPANSFTNIRSALVTILIIFCARRGGEPVRLQMYQWYEAKNGDWIDKKDLPQDFDKSSMLITYQPGKGSDHLVPVMFPSMAIKGMNYITNESVRVEAGVNKENSYVFPSTQNSKGHASGWHSINEILTQLNRKGAINATRNRHRVASLLAKLQLSKQEQDLIFQHFGHSENINMNVYQAPLGAMQLKTTGQRLLQINACFENSVKKCTTTNTSNKQVAQNGNLGK